MEANAKARCLGVALAAWVVGVAEERRARKVMGKVVAVVMHGIVARSHFR